MPVLAHFLLELLLEYLFAAVSIVGVVMFI
jgi:hypothetical protein